MCEEQLEQSVEKTEAEEGSFNYPPSWFKGLILEEPVEEDETRAEEDQWMPPAGCLLEEDPLAEVQEGAVVELEN